MRKGLLPVSLLSLLVVSSGSRGIFLNLVTFPLAMIFMCLSKSPLSKSYFLAIPESKIALFLFRSKGFLEVEIIRKEVLPRPALLS